MNQGKYLKNGLFSIQKCVDDVCDFVSLCGPQRRHEEPQNDFFLSQNIIFIWRSTKNIFQQKIIKINSFEHLQNNVFKTSYKAPQWKTYLKFKSEQKIKTAKPICL